MTRKQTRLEEFSARCREQGLYLSTWSPGDGMTRYRFYDKPGNTYAGPQNGIYTALGRKEAEAFAIGYAAGWAKAYRRLT